jgi:GMP synthase-like glutamine amidotransferase
MTRGPPMNALILQHVPFEGPGIIGHWLAARAASVGYTRFFESVDLPDPATLDLVVAMGGPMSVKDEAAFPWLVAEKRFIAQAIERGVAVLGICLGAQLIASACGARVFPNAEKEIGWFDVVACEGASGSFRFPARSTVLHWHGETFDLPAGAQRLASSAACANQAFQLGARVIGLQFHLEMTPETLQAIVTQCRDELVPGRFIQDEATILASAAGHFGATHALMGEVLDFLTRSPAG